MKTIALLSLLACGGSEPAPAPAPVQPPPAEKVKQPDAKRAAAQRSHSAVFQPVEAVTVADADKAKVDLGRQLYYDTRLSINGKLSCNSCHALAGFGVDNEPTSPGHEGKRGDRNSPTVYHAFMHVAQFWDGREPDVEAQAKGPVTNPVEMGMPDPAYVEKVLKSIPGYEKGFAAAFGGDNPVTYDNMGSAIGAFERHLVTPGRFDAYLGGDLDALTDAELEGLDTFVSTGCVSCHMGPLLGGSTYQKLGLVEPYDTEDIGRAKFTGEDSDKYFFKVPSLRNIAETGPYLHDGSIATLDEMVKLMAKHQLGKELSDKETASIVTFLGALTGEIDKGYIAKPELPENGADTPAPG